MKASVGAHTAAPAGEPAAGAAGAGCGQAPVGGWAQVPYAEPSYWESRDGKSPQPFEWFLGYTALRRVLRAYLPKRLPVLQVRACCSADVGEPLLRQHGHVKHWGITNRRSRTDNAA